MLNIEKYKDDIIACYEKDHSMLNPTIKMNNAIKEIAKTKDFKNLLGAKSVFNWLSAENDHELHILDSVERNYLKSLIKPYLQKFNQINLCVDTTHGHERLTITMKSEKYRHTLVALPPFETETMYKGMVRGILYTPEELEII